MFLDIASCLLFYWIRASVSTANAYALNSLFYDWNAYRHTSCRREFMMMMMMMTVVNMMMAMAKLMILLAAKMMIQIYRFSSFINCSCSKTENAQTQVATRFPTGQVGDDDDDDDGDADKRDGR